MEQFKYERVKKICDDLQSLITVQAYPIIKWKCKKGFFLTPWEVDSSSTPWQDFDSNTDFWHGPDDHYWFRACVEIPQSFNKKPLWLSFVTQATFWDAVNPQFLLFLDGQPVQGLDTNHREIKITDKAKAGDRLTIDLQAYTGRDNDHNHGTTDRLQLMASILELDSRINRLYYNLSVPNRIVKHLDKDSLSRIALQKELEKAINLLDMRVPYSDEFYASVDDCLKFTENEIYKKLAGNDEVIATCIGHTHIDVAWWWTVEQTREKAVRSFSTVLRLMEEFPDYKFMSSQPQLYKFVKERYPDVYEKIKKRVKEGRWEPEGGMWIEADCNVTSGESLVRQFLHGKKFFKEEFDKDNRILWLPDVFGYSAALPQIMRKSGIDYFMTTKIAWNQFNKLPVDTFWWRGIDGSEVFTHLITTQDEGQPADSFSTTYNGMLDPICLMRGWERYQQKEFNNDILISYGYGDGGGGPTREMLETGVRMAKGLPGAPKVRMETAGKYFDELHARTADDPSLPRWNGELYLEYHRGTYTSMARNKRANRKCELLWQTVEFFSVFASMLGVPYDAKEIYDSWEIILLNQFHDILPGSSIKEVYEVTKVEYEALIKRANELIEEKLEAIAKSVNGRVGEIAVFNSLSYDRDDIVEVTQSNVSASSFISQSGKRLPAQRTADGTIIFRPDSVPAMGYAVFTPSIEAVAHTSSVEVKGNEIENDYYHIVLDDKGQFTSIFDKEEKREVLKKGEKGNVLRVYEDKPIYYDNWDIDIYYKEKSWVVDNVSKMAWIEQGPVRWTLQIERKFLQSIIVQNISFYPDSKRIDFNSYVDWKQQQLLLKCEFPVDINTNEATYDIQFGCLKRPTHENTSWDAAKFEVCGHKWADLSEGGYGAALLNDCKYGYGISNGKMTLSLIKSGILPNPTTDQEEHWFTYSFLPHKGDLVNSQVQKEAYCLNVPMYAVRIAGQSEQGGAPEQVVSISCDNVVLETVKQAEDGKGIILRMYENQNKRSKVVLTWNSEFAEAVECDLMENPIGKPLKDAKMFGFTIKPFEIKTFRIVPQE